MPDPSFEIFFKKDEVISFKLIDPLIGIFDTNDSAFGVICVRVR
jgi:hypothetical protein